ncbi:MAG TPA: HAMP domain-containing sensor histidine kinase, partial [Polyangiaceae bacterium]|nr:HAMP domain-containing sensor histidine kinase [Polyangiaceae bacterium]
PAGYIVRANHWACQVLGAERPEVEGTAVESWMPSGDKEQLFAWRNALAHQTAPRLVGPRGYMDLQWRDGRRVPVELGIGPVSIAGRQYYLCAATNIEERLRSAAALEAGAQELALANEELRRYSSALSHDLRAPIRGMLLLANFIQEDDGEQLSEPSREHLGLLRRRGGMALRMVEGLLDLARMDRSSQEKERLDLAQLTEEAFELVGAPPGFQLTLHFSSIELSVVRAALLQVVFNLLNNAVGHHKAPNGSIQVHARLRDGWATIAIEDDGPGIPDAQKDEAFGVFRRFAEPSQAPSTASNEESEKSGNGSTPSGGIGLGLALVKKRVELVGGKVHLSDAPSGGLMVEFTWPSV